ncbi:hypothetical protein I316_01135 [Kwoniella heveanensis BCC8398]|uniref:DUF6534 domain-containing protein n=1 Tax=Kwoniella heveanensis BCC8398 TaxID=1296120 RepID=A0A1B9H1S1_9TREE|nr:hypothetical protein I316_01135 [Kwoniella heveanensis BCC8398]
MSSELPDFGAMSPEQLEAIAKAGLSANRGLNLGPFLLGGIFDIALYGIMTQQYMTWWQFSKPNDRSVTKWLTHYIFFASTVWSIALIAYEMGKFVYHFGQYNYFLETAWPSAFPMVGWSMSGAVQAFYAKRSYRLNGKNKYLLALISFLIVAEGACTVVIVVLIHAKYHLVSQLQAHVLEQEVRLWQCMTLGTDIVITGSLAWGLYKSRTGWSNTDALVKKLILLTLETQLGPTLIMCAFVVQFSIATTSTVSLFMDLIIPKAYTVGYLATLNSRYNLRRDLGGQSSGGNGRSNDIEYSMPETRLGVNRSFKSDIRELDEHEAESVDNLDYAENLSKQNLHGRSDQKF